jgi:hypothetical protein
VDSSGGRGEQRGTNFRRQERVERRQGASRILGSSDVFVPSPRLALLSSRKSAKTRELLLATLKQKPTVIDDRDFENRPACSDHDRTTVTLTPNRSDTTKLRYLCDGLLATEIVDPSHR